MADVLGKNGTRRRRRRVMLGMVPIAALALMVSACGSSASAGDGSSNGSGTYSLTVTTPNLDPGSAINVYLADDLGYFKDAGVNVTRINGVSTGVSLLTSGKTDLIAQGATAGFPVTKQGKPVVDVWNDIGGGALGSIAVAASSPYTSINDLAGQKVGTISTTGSQFGFTNLYSHKVQDAAGKPFTIVPFNDNTTMINAVESGQVKAAGGSAAIFNQAVQAGKLKLIANTTDPTQRTALLGASYTADTALEGIKSNLESKKEAVIRFLQALDRANQYLHTHSLADVAAVIEKDKIFATLPPGTVLQDITQQQPFFTPYGGQISESLWKSTLQLFTRWQIPTIGDVADDPAFSYANFVDMSYLDEAQARNKAS
jgi:ABC-type nitrate/sulfonate/bicarbonate transport system substrate-binding protein